MARKKKKSILDASWFRVVLMVVGAALTTAVLVFSVLTFVKAKNNQLEEAPKFMVWVFIFLGFLMYLPPLFPSRRLIMKRT